MIKRSQAFVPILIFLSFFSCRVPENMPLPVSIVPQPHAYTVLNGQTELAGEVTIVATSLEEKKIAAFLQQFLEQKGFTIQFDEVLPADGPYVALTTDASPSIPPEGYHLTIAGNGVAIRGSTGAGLFYGVQTLFQLLPRSAPYRLPFINLKDEPRFSWRGLHLDVGRHFMPVSFIKRYIDLMAHYKLNTFHWHLTEDQGWRIEIKKYPKLQEVAAYRNETVIGRATTRTRHEPHEYDGTRHGGYYTQDEIKEVVAYAAQRYVTVVPEIEMPGHALAALAAYPHLGCSGGPYQVATTWGIFNEVFCAGKESTFEFLQNVLDEVIPLFPGPYIHIGGDECFKDSWKKCAHCQKRIKSEKLKDENELQSYFIRRIEKYVNAKGKSIIGWDEILEGGLAPNATVMSWRGEEGGIAAVQQGHKVVMTPSNWLYFDYMQDSARQEPLAVRVLVTVKTVYDYDPVPPQLTAEQVKHVLGVQANVWTEYMKTPEHIEYMVYPRAIALAEIAWTKKENKNYDDFLRRLTDQRKMLDLWQVNYAKHAFDIMPVDSRF